MSKFRSNALALRSSLLKRLNKQFEDESTPIAFNQLCGEDGISANLKAGFSRGLFGITLLYGCRMWPHRVEDRKPLEISDNGCLRHIGRCNHREWLPCSILHQFLQPHTLQALLSQRNNSWVRHAAHRAPRDVGRSLIQTNG